MESANEVNYVDRIEQIRWLYQLADSVYSSAAYSETDAIRDSMPKDEYIDALMTDVEQGAMPCWYDDHDAKLLRDQFGRLITQM